MGYEATPELVLDQGLYYSDAGNYYGYYSTLESPGELDESDHHRFFALDGQGLHYSGLQTESLPYVYLTPGYGYAQSPYNPYNPYIPGAVIGADGQFIGSQQYFPNPSYEQPVTSAYIPTVIQSSSDSVANCSPDPSFINIGASVASWAPEIASTKYAPLLSPANAAATSENVALGTPTLEPSMSLSNQIQTSVKLSNRSLYNAAQSKQSLSHGSMIAGSASHVTQATGHVRNEGVSSVHSPLGVMMPANNGFTNFGSSVNGWTTLDKFRHRFQHSRALTNRKGSMDILGDQNRGPRTNRSKDAHKRNPQGNAVNFSDQYNRDDFLVDYPVAKFFVIKSYTEDDVHKSIKYNVWSSTPYGNKKLDNAYEDAQRISVGKPRKCPVFLFFSVNTSGQFCGVAEMTGCVDFHKKMDFWQQDKWIGSFPVTWHIIKDVPNTSLRHILLENNEFIPVTSSRDTQEVTYIPGMGMLKIFKQSPLSSSLLDDFMYYEEHERIMREQKIRLLGRSHGSSLLSSVFVPSIGLRGVCQPPEAYEKQLNGAVKDHEKADKEEPNHSFDRSLKSDEIEPTVPVEEPLKEGRKQLNGTVNQPLEADVLHGDVDDPRRADLIQQNFNFNQLSETNGIKPSGTVDQTPEADGKQLNGVYAFDQPSKSNAGKLDHAVHPSNVNRNQSNMTARCPSRTDGKQLKHLADEHPKAVGKQPNYMVNQPLNENQTNDIVIQSLKLDQNPTSTSVMEIGGKGGSCDLVAVDPGDVNGVNSVIKFGSLSIDSKVVEANSSSVSGDVVTIGSVAIKIDKQSESFSGFTVGSVPVVEGRKLKQQGDFSDK